MYKIQIFWSLTVTQLISSASGTCRYSLRWGSSLQMLMLYQQLHTWQNKQEEHWTIPRVQEVRKQSADRTAESPVILISNTTLIYFYSSKWNNHHYSSTTPDATHVLWTHVFINPHICEISIEQTKANYTRRDVNILRNPYMTNYSLCSLEKWGASYSWSAATDISKLS